MILLQALIKKSIGLFSVGLGLIGLFVPLIPGAALIGVGLALLSGTHLKLYAYLAKLVKNKKKDRK